MIWRVKDILPVIAEQLGGNGVDIACNPAATQQALDAYNRINEIFMNRHDWPGTEMDVCLTARAGCLTLPERFETIKALRVDNDPVRVLPMGWEYLESGPGILDANCPIEAMQLLGTTFPTFHDLPFPMQVGAIATTDHDDGQKLTVQGIAADGKPLRNGWMPGLEIPIRRASAEVSPFMTNLKVASITALSKPVTCGDVELFGWDAARNQMHWLSRLGPTETSPSYTRYKLSGPWCDGGEHNVRARVTLRYVPLYSLEDVSLVQHREAYRLAAQAITAFDDMDGARGSEFMNRAIRMLKDRVAKLENGARKAPNVNVSHRRPLRSGWHYTTR